MERLFRTIVETAADGIFVIDADGRILEVNPAGAAQFGATPETLRGLPVETLFFLDEAAERPASFLLPRGAATAAPLRREVWGRRCDGRTFPGEISFSEVLQEEGPRVAAILHDTSLRKAQRDALREREERLSAILATIPDAIVTVDDQGLIESFSESAERMFGYRADEVIGQNVRLLMPSPYREAHDGYIERYIRTGERRIIGIGRVVVGLRADGTTFPMELHVGEMKTAGRRLFIGFVRDLTEKEDTERRLQDLQAQLMHTSRLRLLGRMATTLAHEINQPLTAIANYMQAARHLLESGRSELIPRALDAVTKAAAQATRAGEIIRRLRSFVSRGESEKTPQDLNKLIEEATALALVGAREWKIRVHFALGADLAPVLADRIQIQQVILNIVRNAVEVLQNHDPREIHITTARSADGSGAVVSIRDTGPGLPPEVEANLFRPFISTKKEGMGLGLSICREIVETHGGHLTVQTAPGEGTTFTFTLPFSPTGEAIDDAA
jgi:two-component system sensor kinase FixL